jgi:hypothetical protein
MPSTSPPAATSTEATDADAHRAAVFRRLPESELLHAHLRELLAGRGRHDAIELVRVDSCEDALARRFLGSPTLRIGGVDVEPGAAERDDYGLKCRLFHRPAGLAGVPDDAWIVAALDRADDAAAALARVGLDASRIAGQRSFPPPTGGSTAAS